MVYSAYWRKKFKRTTISSIKMLYLNNDSLNLTENIYLGYSFGFK